MTLSNEVQVFRIHQLHSAVSHSTGLGKGNRVGLGNDFNHALNHGNLHVNIFNDAHPFSTCMNNSQPSMHS